MEVVEVVMDACVTRAEENLEKAKRQKQKVEAKVARMEVLLMRKREISKGISTNIRQQKRKFSSINNIVERKIKELKDMENEYMETQDGLEKTEKRVEEEERKLEVIRDLTSKTQERNIKTEMALKRKRVDIAKTEKELAAMEEEVKQLFRQLQRAGKA